MSLLLAIKHSIIFSFRFLSAYPWWSRDVAVSPWGAAGLTRAKSSSHNGHRPGYTLDELPAHRRTLTDGICTAGATLGFSILLKDTLRCSSVPHRGAGIRIDDLLITSPPALPTELQPPQYYILITQKKVLYFNYAKTMSFLYQLEFVVVFESKNMQCQVYLVVLVSPTQLCNVKQKALHK